MRHNIDATSVVFLASPRTFDPSFGDIFATWFAGGVVACAPKIATFSSLDRCLAMTHATHVLTTPALLDTMPSGTERLLPHLRCVALGGEATPTHLARIWMPHVVLLNTYGVTECCVYQTVCQISKETIGNTKRLGAPLQGNVLLFARDSGDDPNLSANEGSGELAELWITGPQVGVGYLNRSKLTEEKFCQVMLIMLGGVQTWCFRTGDIVRMDVGGPTLLGRKDSQVKLNGQRVELGEVEAGVLRGAGSRLLRSAAAVIITVGEEEEVEGSKSRTKRQQQRLVLWCVPSTNTSMLLDEEWEEEEEEEEEHKKDKKDKKNKKEEQNGEEEERTSQEIPSGRRPDVEVAPIFHDVIRWLSGRELPLHMLPTRVGFLGSLPVTSSGKVARRPLQRRGLPLVPRREEGTRREGSGRHEAIDLNDPLSKAVSDVWTEILGVPLEVAGGHFIEMGGDSLAALRACRHLRTRLQSKKIDETEVAVVESSFAGEALGVFSPLELLKRPRIEEYTRYLRSAMPNASVQTKSDEEREEQDDARKVPNIGQALTGREIVMDAGAELLYRSSLVGAHACVERLLEAGVSPGRFGASSPLHAACARGNLQSARVLVASGVLCNAKNSHGATPLIQATSAQGSAKHISALVKVLLRGGALLSVTDSDAQSSLHAAARTGQSKAVMTCLLEACDSCKGAEAKALRKKGPMSLWKDAWGRTPLHWASVNGHRGACAFLLNLPNGSKAAQMKDDRGERPVDCAERRALCSAKERPDGARSSVWGDIAKLLGGSGTTKHLKSNKVGRV